MTYRDIARIAHVSTSTVSKALKGSKEISSELCEEIRRIAVDIGYFKEKSQRRMVENKVRGFRVSVICPEIVSIYYSSLVEKLAKNIENLGGFPTFYTYNFDNKKLKKVIDTILLNDMTDGIILVSSGIDEIKNVPLVQLLCGEENENYDSVFINNEDVFDKIIAHLKELGHIKIGFAGEKHTMTKLDAFKKSLKKNGIDFYNEFVYISNNRFENIGYEAAQKIIASKERPTAVVAAYDEVALSLIHKLNQSDILVPDDISVIGINDIPFSAYSSVPLTTIRLFSDECCEIASKKIFDKIYNNDECIQKIRIMPELIVRKSTTAYKGENNYD